MYLHVFINFIDSIKWHKTEKPPNSIEIEYDGLKVKCFKSKHKKANLSFQHKISLLRILLIMRNSLHISNI